MYRIFTDLGPFSNLEVASPMQREWRVASAHTDRTDRGISRRWTASHKVTGPSNVSYPF